MLSAFGLAYSADAAVAFARAVAVGIGGRNARIISIGVVRELGGKMFRAFYQVCENSENDDGNQKRQSGSPHDRLLRMLERYPEMLNRYPWMQVRYPKMFKQANINGGYNNALIMH